MELTCETCGCVFKATEKQEHVIELYGPMRNARCKSCYKKKCFAIEQSKNKAEKRASDLQSEAIQKAKDRATLLGNNNCAIAFCKSKMRSFPYAAAAVAMIDGSYLTLATVDSHSQFESEYTCLVSAFKQIMKLSLNVTLFPSCKDICNAFKGNYTPKCPKLPKRIAEHCKQEKVNISDIQNSIEFMSLDEIAKHALNS